MEIEIKNGKFWMLENRADEKNVQRFVYDEIKLAFERLKELIKTVDADKLLLSTIDVTDSKGWNIVGTSWSVIAMGIVRGDISEIDVKDTNVKDVKGVKK